MIGTVHVLRERIEVPAEPSLGRFDPDRLDRRNPRWIASVLPALRAFNSLYFRMQVDGVENIPRSSALFVANHNGGIAGPDLCCTFGVLWDTLGPEAPLYALAHDFAMRQFTMFGRLLQRLGAVRATRNNALSVLRRGGQAIVYPGGDLDAYRHFRRRDEIVFGGRTGFVRVAQEAGVPIIPIIAQGAHRSAFIFHEGHTLARHIRLKRWGRLERFPVAFALPWGIALGPWIPYLPLPWSIRLRILSPIRVPADADPAAVRDDIRARMQAAVLDMAALHRAWRPARSGSERS